MVRIFWKLVMTKHGCFLFATVITLTQVVNCWMLTKLRNT